MKPASGVRSTVFWGLIAVTVAVFVGASALKGWWNDVFWTTYLIGLASGIGLAGCAFFCAADDCPESSLDIVFQRGRLPLVRVIRRRSEP